MRAIVALVAAYAVALQAMALAVGGPIGGVAGFAAHPICAPANTSGSPAAPAGHRDDCLAGCLACCCGAAAPAPVAPFVPTPMPARKVAAAIEVAPATLHLRVSRAHRSRAPPFG